MGLILGLVVLYKSRADRVDFIDDVRFYAELVGKESRGPILDRDVKSLEERLSLFQSISIIKDGVVFGADDKALASYSRSGDAFVPSNPEEIKPFEFKDEYLYVLVPISDGEQTYGNIFVRASTKELKRKINFYIFIMAALFILGLSFVYFLARNFQSVITRPLSNLIAATKKISGPGEAGALVKKEKKNEFLILRDRMKYLLDLENRRQMRLEEINKARQQVIELEKSGKEYRERFENNAYGIFVFEADDNGEDFVIKDLNTTGEVLERIHRADLIGKKITEVYPELKNSKFLDALQNVWQRDTKKFIPFFRLKGKEDTGWREFYINKLPSKDIVAVFRDVSDKKAEREAREREREKEKKRFEEELIKQKEQEAQKLERSPQQRALNKELDGLFSATANYLGDPLEKIDGFSKSFLQDYAGKVDDEGKNRLIQIRAATVRLMQMIKDLGKVAELSMTSLKPEPVDLSDIVKKRVVKLKEGNPERKAEFDIQDNVKVTGDARMLSIVIDNLMSNAWIYSSKKTNIKIEFGVKEDKDVKEYYIRDNGIGFDMKDVDKMFRPFKKLNEDEVFPGSGMGLAIARRIIHRHGGVIRAEGKPGEGAVFYFTLGG